MSKKTIEFILVLVFILLASLAIDFISTSSAYLDRIISENRGGLYLMLWYPWGYMLSHAVVVAIGLLFYSRRLKEFLSTGLFMLCTIIVLICSFYIPTVLPFFLSEPRNLSDQTNAILASDRISLVATGVILLFKIVPTIIVDILFIITRTIQSRSNRA